MHIPQNAPKSSFGIPPEVKENMENQRAVKEAQEKMKKEADDVQSDGPPIEEDTGYESGLGINPEEKINPINVLKTIGIDFTEDDLQSLVFTGSVEKEVTVVKMAKRPLTATFKTITGEEYDESEELFGEDVSELTMTAEARDTRHNMWKLAYSVVQLNGRVLVNVKDSEGKDLGRKEIVKQRREVLNKLSPAVIRKLMNIYGKLMLSVNLLVEEPDNPLFIAPSEPQKASGAVN